MGPPEEIGDVVAMAPHDDAAQAVLADWLIQAGDPRGELVALQLQSERTQEIADRIAKLGRALDPVPDCPGLTWRRGFVHRAVITERELAMLPVLLRSSASWGLCELIALARALPRLLPILVEHAAGLPALTSLQLRAVADPVEPLDIEPVVVRLPRLARLRVDVPHRPFWVASDLVELSMLTDTPEQRPAWAERPQPRLERLWLRSTTELRSVPWLVPDRFPRLRRLGLVGRDRCDAPLTGFDLARREVVVYGPANPDSASAARTWSILEEPPASDLTGDAALIGMGGDAFAPGTLVRLTGGNFRIGRGVGHDLRLPSAYISKRHTVLHRRDGWTVIDLASSWGTLLEGTAVGLEPCPLRNGHDLQVGCTLFRFLQGDVPALAAAARRELGLDDDRARAG